MSITDCMLLGLVQGATEFLPVSSSAHLVILQNLLGVRQPQLFLDAALHFGTLTATIAVLRDEIFSLLKGVWLYALYRVRGERSLPGEEHRDLARVAGLVCIGLIPTVMVGFFFRDYFERLFASLMAVGVLLIITGIVLWMTRNMAQGTKEGAAMSIADALLIGFVQGLAIAPGISRSGITISCGLIRHLTKGFSFRFSFLLSVPAIVGALVLEWQAPVFSSGELPAVMAGALTAAVVGYACLRILRTMVQEGRLHFFSPYCWVVGSAAILLSFVLP